ncbi:unnamed protein product [Citrullus colocynthis]|uniref:Uncharacterized protein n=1 Tax=Citrullus colocynthis TaxID=252529 RepID=A0ABP0YA44_9ROSI
MATAMHGWGYLDSVTCYFKSTGLIEIYLDRWKFVNSGVPGRAVSRGILYNLQLFLKMVALTVVSGEEVEMTSTNVLHYIIRKAWEIELASIEIQEQRPTKWGEVAIKRDDTETKRVNGSVSDGRHEWDEEQALFVKVERR